MDFGALLAKVMVVMSQAQDLSKAIDDIHQEIQRLIVTRAEANEITIHEEEYPWLKRNRPPRRWPGLKVRSSR